MDKATGYVWRSNPTDADADVIGQSAGHAYYRSKSQLVFSYAQGYNYYDANSYYSCVVNDLVTCTVNAGKSVKFLYKFADHKFAVPVEYSLDSNGFKAELLLNDSDAKLSYSEIGSVSAGNFGKVEQQIDYNITEIKLLPAFGATSYNEDGTSSFRTEAERSFITTTARTTFSSLTARLSTATIRTASPRTTEKRPTDFTFPFSERLRTTATL